MANDRIVLRCTTCGAEKVMVKYHVDFITHWTVEPAPDFPRIDEFMEKHLVDHHPNWLCGTLNGNPGFEIVTESDYPPEVP